MAMQNYFDYAATCPMSELSIRSYAKAASEYPFNPSSKHRGGREAHKALEEAREKCARVLSVMPEQLVFTSGATESISMVFESLLWQKKPGRVIISRIEHDAVKSFIPLLKEKGWDVVQLKAKDGIVKAGDVKAALTEETRLVSIMSVNNVNGAVEDVNAISAVIREYEKSLKHRIIFFSDSVQALGKVGLSLSESGIDAASFSAHKIGGPRGVGMLYVRKKELIRSLAPAGGQEGGMRGGTENLASIISFSDALEDIYHERAEKEKRMAALNKRLREGLSEAGLLINSPDGASPYILNVSSPLPSEVFTRMLDDKGFSVSSGSACSNNARKGENIIEAMGYGRERAMSSIRISMFDSTSEKEVEDLIATVKEMKSEF